MFWVKQGLIYCPEGLNGWDITHAQVPTPILIDDDTIRIFYSSRNNKSESQISFLDVSAEDPSNVIYINPEPILTIGMAGTFDDCGVMPSWAVYNENELYLYYIGWNVRNTVPYYNSVGLAISGNNKDFKKFSDGPLWDRNYREPYFSASTCVLFHENRWKNWYLSCTGYQLVMGKYEPRYHIKYAESVNGIDWVRKGIIAIDYKSYQEAGIVKASVMIDNERFKMWYSYRNIENYRTDIKNSYKIGYAESYDGLVWTRMDDQSGIKLSESGWDSQMQAYPHVIDVRDKRYMFYNGNEFGKSGFGFAVYQG